MFPEGHGKPVATTLSGKAAPFTNALVVNSKAASDELWKRRGYDPKTPDVTKARLGYRLDREEVAGWVLTRALKLPLLSPSEARCIGKRVGNSLLPKAALGKAIAQHKNEEARQQHCRAAAAGGDPQPGAAAAAEAEAIRRSRRAAADTATPGALAAASAATAAVATDSSHATAESAGALCCRIQGRL